MLCSLLCILQFYFAVAENLLSYARHAPPHARFLLTPASGVSSGLGGASDELTRGSELLQTDVGVSFRCGGRNVDHGIANSAKAVPDILSA